MRILFINPNSTDSMTAKILAAAEAVAPTHATILAHTSHAGPPAIQGPADGEAALPGLLDEIDRGKDHDADAFVIACFDDTGLFEALARTQQPVIGIGQAAFHTSMLLGHRFSVVTTLSVSVPVIDANIDAYGMRTHCARVRASEVPVLDLEKPGSEAEQRVSDEIAIALRDDNCEAIVLGCAGMADLAGRLSERHGVPVIDGVVAATGLAVALVGMG